MKSKDGGERCEQCYAKDPWRNDQWRGFLIVTCDVCGWMEKGRVDEEAPVPSPVKSEPPKWCPKKPSGDNLELIAAVRAHFQGRDRGVLQFIGRVLRGRTALEDFVYDRFHPLYVSRGFPYSYDTMRRILLESMDVDVVLGQVVDYAPSTSARVLKASVDAGESFELVFKLSP